MKDRRPWTILILLCVAQFMVILDVTVVNVALPSIGSDLHFAAEDLQWVVSAYVLFTGSLLLLGGRMADMLGRRPVFLAGLLVFTAASLTSGLAASPTALIVSRAVQGLGAAMLSPAALSIITTTYTGAQRTTALSAWGAIGAGGAAAGVLFGGMLTTWLSWEWVFFVNVPIGFVAAALAMRMLPRKPARLDSLAALDLPGAISLVGGLVLLVLGITGTSTHGWGSARTIVLLALAATLLTGFATVERRVGKPLVPPDTWRLRSLVSSATVMLGTTGIMVGTFFLNSLFLQNVLGASALEAGFAFLPLVVAIGIAAHLGPHLLEHAGARAVVVAGLAVIAGANAYLSTATADATYVADLLPAYLALGLGIGFVFVSVSVTSMSEIGHGAGHHSRAGLASGLMTTAHEIGAALGVAVFSAVALGTGATAALGAAFTDGYTDGAVLGAAIAAGLAVIALVAVPAFRPAPGQAVAVH